VHLHFLTGPSFHAPDPLRLGRLKLANKTFVLMVGIAEAVLLHQILVDTPGTQACLDLGSNYLGQRFTVTPAPSRNAGNRNGWF
jgi:hypothetical protein